MNGECGTCDDQLNVKDPVCGYDGIQYHTFQNVCFLKMKICKLASAGQKMTLAYYGECKTSSSLTGVKPGTQLGTSGTASVSDRCSTQSCTSTEKLLICGTDGNTYYNKCEFMQAQCKYTMNNMRLDVAYMGECRTTDTKPATQLGTSGSTSVGDKCNMNCVSTEKYPICGTDGVTYQNKCFFYQEKCRKDAAGEKFDVSHIGACKTYSLTGSVLTSGSKTSCSTALRCDTSAQRICGSDGNVYGSECEFLRAQCSNPRLTRVRCSSLTAVVG